MQLADGRYGSMLDKLVKHAKDLHSPRMTPGRVYDSSGEEDDLQSLLSVQALLLASTLQERAPIPTIDDYEENVVNGFATIGPCRALRSPIPSSH